MTTSGFSEKIPSTFDPLMRFNLLEVLIKIRNFDIPDAFFIVPKLVSK